MLAELTISAFSVAGRRWVRNNGQGGRKALIRRFDDAISAVPASLDLSAPCLDLVSAYKATLVGK